MSRTLSFLALVLAIGCNKPAAPPAPEPEPTLRPEPMVVHPPLPKPKVHRHKIGDKVAIGDLVVSIPRVLSGQAGGQYYGGYRSMNCLQVSISVENTHKGKIAEWPGWQDELSVEDEHGNKFAPLDLKGWSWLPNNDDFKEMNGDRGARVHPGKTYNNLIYHQFAPATSKQVVIAVKHNGEWYRFDGPIFVPK